MDHNYPSTWTNMRLGDMEENVFYKGKGLAKSDLIYNGAYSCIHYGELFTIYKEYITTIYNNTNLFKNCFLSKKNDVLMPTSDVTPNGLATASCILQEDIVLGGDILVIRISPNKLNGIFLAYMIKYQKKQVMKLVSGTTVYHLYRNDMAQFTFSYPSLKEQQKIVTVLSDMDSFIEKTESIIQKKRHIKMATMQQLLTPKDHWVTSSLSEIADVRDGTHESPQLLNKGVRFVTSKNIVNNKLDLFNTSFISELDAYGINQRSQVHIGDILFSMIGTVGLCTIVKDDCNFCIKNIGLIKNNASQYCNDYLCQYLQSPEGQQKIQSQLTGGIQKFFSLHLLRNFKIPLPPTLEEQQEIAAILSDMDREIEVLEQKVIKLKNIKKASMDILLTGKIRLV